MCMNGGMFVFELFNWYSASWSILALAVLGNLIEIQIIKCKLLSIIVQRNSFLLKYWLIGIFHIKVKWTTIKYVTSPNLLFSPFS